MGRTHRRQVYPREWATELLGTSAGRLNAAIECWAQAVQLAQAEVEQMLGRQEWNYLADTLNGTMIEPGISNPGVVLMAEVADADRLNGYGEEWFGEGGSARAAALARRCKRLSYCQAWAIILATQWFWDHCADVNHQTEDWWTLAFRREYAGDAE